MSSYKELVKSFENIRGYMRDFYVYGLKSRAEYDRKSLRSYDDERRRVEGWLGDYIGFRNNSDGKRVFISIDSRNVKANPLYQALKSKSFTDIDITLHFIILDILNSSQRELSLNEILNKISCEYLCYFENPITFDESTVRKKLKEYQDEGIICSRKDGRKSFYRRSEDIKLPEASDAVEFFSEVLPCGVIGSFLLDKYERHEGNITFKHHYMTHALDSQILTMLFLAMREHRYITFDNHSRRSTVGAASYRLIPLKVFISVQNGRQHLIGYNPKFGDIRSYRLDYISNVKLAEVCDDFDKLRQRLSNIEKYIWGVGCKSDKRRTERVEFTICVGDNEEYIVNRLYREKRKGTVERIDNNTYRFSAEVFDTHELVPWIRTFICRIVDLRFSNRTVENQFKNDIEKMYKMYGINGRRGGEK